MERGSDVVDTSSARRAIVWNLFEHNLFVVGHGDLMLGGDHVGAGEGGANLRFVEVAADGPVSLDGHHGVDVGLAVDDLACGGHRGWQGVGGIGVRGGVVGGVGGHGEAVDGADERDDGGVGDALFGGLFGDGCDEFGVADF